MTQQVMNQYMGAALRAQLDGLVRALATEENTAREAGDTDVLALLDHLRQARDAAARIEERPDLVTKGVKLTRN